MWQTSVAIMEALLERPQGGPPSRPSEIHSREGGISLEVPSRGRGFQA